MTFRIVLVMACSLLTVQAVLAHPGVGIVMSSRGDVYYTDLQRVWRISAEGKKSIAVPNVHTHEMYLDPNDNLFGEHLWYEGDATGRWGHRVWRLGPDGTLKDVIPSRPGFLDDYDDFHFVHDRAGNMYWARRGETTSIVRRSPGGAVSTLVSARFQDVRWMTATAEGTVYLIDLHDLVRVAPDGCLRTVATNIADDRRTFLLWVDRHAVMGLWTDSQGNVYAAVSSDRLVRRISPNGDVAVAASSPRGWSPTGGLVAPNGDLWLLEYGGSAGARARRIDRNGKSTVFE